MADQYDPIFRLARLRIVKLSADLEVQLGDKKGSAPAIEILRRLKDRAAESLAGLVTLNYDDPADVMKAKVLSNEVKRYDEWIADMKTIVHEGIAYDKQFSDEEREELLDYLARTPEGQQEAIALGLVTQTSDDA